MSGHLTVGRTRWLWHPLTATAVVTGGAVWATATSLTSTSGWPVLAVWLSLGAIAGYATSGST
jgi:hypothetical protein